MRALMRVGLPMQRLCKRERWTQPGYALWARMVVRVGWCVCVVLGARVEGSFERSGRLALWRGSLLARVCASRLLASLCVGVCLLAERAPCRRRSVCVCCLPGVRCSRVSWPWP
jgi:hypothetical protein